MADERVTYEVAAKFTGEGELRRGAAEFERLGRQAKTALSTTTAAVGNATGNAFRGLAEGAVVAGAAYFAVAAAARKAYAALQQGVELQTTTERFGKLATQINSTSDALLGKLRAATQNTIPDMQLMAAASEVMFARLAENEDQAARLTAVMASLGWDTGKVASAFSGLNETRLNALGLSIDEVKQKQSELISQGMDMASAYREAIIQAGEARLEVNGISEAEQSFKQATTAVTNYKDALLGSIISTLDQAGAFDALSLAASNMALAPNFREQIDAMHTSGALTTKQYQQLIMTMRYLGAEAAQAQLQAIEAEGRHRTELMLLNDAVDDNGRGWRQWNVVTGQALNGIEGALDQVRYLAVGTTEIVLSATEAMSAGLAMALEDWGSASISTADIRGAARQAQREINTAFVRNDPAWAEAGQKARREMEYDTEAVYRYGGALSALTEEEQKAAEAHERFMSSFNQELRAAPEDGLYNAEGVANVEAVNKALYEQVEAAGASAATLALLGVATGQFTQEQAEAALKAAVLQEQIRAIAASVAAGDLSIGDALGQLNQAREALDASNLAAVAGTGEGGVSIAVTADTSTAETNLDGTAAQLDALTSEEYIATLGMDINAVIEGTTEAGRLIGSLPDTKTLTIRWEQSGADVIAALRALGIIV